MRKSRHKVTTFCCDFLFAFSVRLGERNFKILASDDLVDLAIVAIFVARRCFGGYSIIKVKRETGESPVQSRCCKSYQTT